MYYVGTLLLAVLVAPMYAWHYFCSTFRNPTSATFAPAILTIQKAQGKICAVCMVRQKISLSEVARCGNEMYVLLLAYDDE